MATYNPRLALTLILLIGATVTLGACDVFDDDSDAKQTVNLQVDNATTVEGNDGTIELQFRVTADPGNNPVKISVNTLNDTAIAGEDYIGIANSTITIPSNATTATVSVTIIGDEAFEPDESFIVRLSTRQDPQESAQGIGTIANDDLERNLQVGATYTYDDLNRVTSVLYDNGKTIEFDYDAAGNVLRVEVTTP